jgi:Undecaprenyl-phosphate galactose phosphotransferase WbaP
MKNKLVLLAVDFTLLLLAYGLGFALAETFRISLHLAPGEYGLIDAPTGRHISFALVVLGLVFWLGIVQGHYLRRSPFWAVLRDIFVAVCFAALCDAAIMYMMKLPFARLAWALGWIGTLALLPIGRRIAVALLIKLDWWQRPVFMVGNGENALAAWRAIESDPFMGYRICQIARLPEKPLLEELADLAAIRNVTTSTGVAGVQGFISLYPQARVVIALESEDMLTQAAMISSLSRLNTELIIVPSLKGLPLYGTEPLFFFSHEILLLQVRNNLARWFPIRIKRLFDLLVSTMGLIAIAPFFIWIVLRIRADGGPAIYQHQRVGQGGKAFGCYKFRTMVIDSEQVLEELLQRDQGASTEWARDFKLKNDPRITRIGEFLRKTSLDELPQLLNVIKGEMSLVGPRPIIQEEVSRYGDNAHFYFEAKPGITGLWQVSGRNDIGYSRRVMLDTWYVQNWSLWHDIIIIFKTLPVVWKGDGAY